MKYIILILFISFSVYAYQVKKKATNLITDYPDTMDTVSTKESAIEREVHHPRKRIRQIESNSGTRSPGDSPRAPVDPVRR